MIYIENIIALYQAEKSRWVSSGLEKKDVLSLQDCISLKKEIGL